MYGIFKIVASLLFVVVGCQWISMTFILDFKGLVYKLTVGIYVKIYFFIFAKYICELRIHGKSKSSKYVK